MTSKIVTAQSWNDTHTGAMRFKVDSGFVVIVGTNVVWRCDYNAAEKFAKAVEPLTDDQIAESLG